MSTTPAPKEVAFASGITPSDAARQRRARLAEALLTGSISTAPVQHWTQGAARVAQALMGGSMLGKLDQEDAADRTKANEMLAKFENAPDAQPAQQADSRKMRIAELLSNRYTAPIGQSLIAKSLENQFAPKDTDEIREYNLAKQQGETRSFTEWKTGVKQASATKINNVVNAGETAFSKGAGEGVAKRYNELSKDAQDANSLIGDISAIRDIGSRIQTGKGAEAKRLIGPYAAQLGINIKDLNDIQAYDAIISRIQPRMRVAGSGATSDYEMKQFLQALPNLGNQPGGNEMIANTMEAIQQTKRAQGEIASRALSGEIKPAQAEKMLRELPDPFAAWKKSRGSSPTSAGSSLKSKYGLE